MALKAQIFAQLDEIVRSDAILASNTSSLSITEIANSTNRPTQVVGLHFFNPAPIQKFVEIITTTKTTESLVQDLRALAAKLGKQAAVISDQPGFIVNRLLLVYLNHAAQLLADGKYDLATIDSAMRERAGFPMGPLELADLIGLDTCVAILQTIAQFTHDANHEPASNMLALVAAKNLGRKTGAGFYSYEQRHVPAQSENESAKAEVFDILHTAYLADAAAMAASGYATAREINDGMMLGCGLPQGPLAD
jgi:3-hydroxybutyryl-CoA dehydrogenase